MLTQPKERKLILQLIGMFLMVSAIGFLLVTRKVRSRHAEIQNLPPIKKQPRAVKRNYGLPIVLFCALCVSVGSFVYFFVGDETLLYTDAQSHLLIAERALHSPTAGYSQYGGVWLPLPHILMYPLLILPFGIGTYLYQTGLAGSIISM